MNQRLLDSLQRIANLKLDYEVSRNEQVREQELDALREKTAALDVLSERIASGAWRVEQWEPVMRDLQGVKITITRTGERITSATLAEAVTKAMEAEREKGER